MSPHPPCITPLRVPHRKTGSALIITLSFLILLSIVVLGYLTTSGSEQRISRAYNGKTEARLFNSMATEIAAARIASATQNGADGSDLEDTNNRILPGSYAEGNWWVTQPGLIANTPYPTSNAGAANRPTTTLYELSSGAAPSLIKDLSVDLNPVSLRNKAHGITAGNPALRLPLRWVYVKQDGTHLFKPDVVPPYDAENPIIGRYAFWADDESSRINLNTVALGTAPETLPSSHPGKLNLLNITPLTLEENTKIRKSLNEDGPFTSLEDVKRIDFSGTYLKPNAAGSTSPTVIATALASHQESLTHFAHSQKGLIKAKRTGTSPKLNGAGIHPYEKIVLTTQKSVAGDRPFLDILTNDNTDPGDEQNLSKAKLIALANKLYAIFSEQQAWEYGLIESTSANNNLFNKTFSGTYSPVGTAQIIFNIIDYVRSIESTRPLVDPLRGAFIPPAGIAPPTFSFLDGTGTLGVNAENGIVGNSRRLHVVELGLHVPKEPTTTVVSGSTRYGYSVTVKMRIHLPKSAPAEINLLDNKIGMYCRFEAAPGSVAFPFRDIPNVPADYTLSAGDIEGGPTIKPGEYRTLSKIGTIYPPEGDRPDKLMIRSAIRYLRNTPADFVNLDLAPLSVEPATMIPYTVDPPEVPIEEITSISVNDPRVNQSWRDWRNSQGPNNFGSVTAPTAKSRLGKTPGSFTPEQDTDAEGNITEVSILPPPPKGSPGNLTGLVQSVAELGKVHSGGRGASQQGIPWRSIRLQPGSGEITARLPDWILFEIFEAPGTAQELVFNRSTRNIKGKINLNQRLSPFPAPIDQERTLPLTLALRNASSNLSEAEAKSIALNLIERKTVGFNYGTAEMISAGLYSLIGEVCEIEGISSGGEETEKNLHGFVDHLTTRSNTFSVYSIGQKITQYPSGKIEVRGEARSRTLLERQIDGSLRNVQTLDLGE